MLEFLVLLIWILLLLGGTRTRPSAVKALAGTEKGTVVYQGHLGCQWIKQLPLATSASLLEKPSLNPLFKNPFPSNSL
ncbi:MAG: hypothetical protein DRP71_16640 [Verrucomicrobia bacterium]|nr:MAG: hypothetical protein DRP71_16640 [Verrucomicrobiota bacterium]